MNLLAAYGLLAHGLIFGALVSRLPIGFLQARAGLAGTALALVVGIAPAMHAFFGTPSATLLALAILQLAGYRHSTLSPAGAGALLLFASLYFTAALGWGPLDPYGLGFQPWALLGGLLPVGLALWWRRLHLWLGILSIDLLLYAAGVFDNLWDALLDPLLILLAGVILLRQQILRALAKRARPRQT
ncbi:MAG: hypothetical protein L6Q40_08870 [Azonexus sp.]|nr:hypothetical protein [Azonexus sp.]